MTESHLFLIMTILSVLWMMGLIRLTPRRWSQRKANQELAQTILKDSTKGVFK